MLSRNRCKGHFALDVPIYIEMLKNEHFLCAVVLQYSYGLIEQHVKDVLFDLLNQGIIKSSLDLELNNSTRSLEEQIDKEFFNGGIEVWGDRILNIVNRKWNKVAGGKIGIVEVALVRNAIAHGNPVVTQRIMNRCYNNGIQLRWGLGQPIKLNFSLLEEYRAHLRSFARVITVRNKTKRPAGTS